MHFFAPTSTRRGAARETSFAVARLFYVKLSDSLQDWVPIPAALRETKGAHTAAGAYPGGMEPLVLAQESGLQARRQWSCGPHRPCQAVLPSRSPSLCARSWSCAESEREPGGLHLLPPAGPHPGL